MCHIRDHAEPLGTPDDDDITASLCLCKDKWISHETVYVRMQVIGGRERWICRGAEAEDRTAAARETQSPGREPNNTSTSILPVWSYYPFTKGPITAFFSV